MKLQINMIESKIVHEWSFTNLAFFMGTEIKDGHQQSMLV